MRLSSLILHHKLWNSLISMMSAMGIAMVCMSYSIVVEHNNTAMGKPQYMDRPPSSLPWHPCGQNMMPGSDCALLSVPLDYAHPQHDTIRIGISRLKATHPQERLGTLFVNAGGPGADGNEGLYIVSHHDFDQVRKHFDIIGFDPRGIGQGNKLRCTRPIENAHISMLPLTSEQFQQLSTYNHDTSQGCLQATGSLINHVDTLSVADDIDKIRQALGEKTISFYGTSYGSEIGELYAQRYPTHLRAIVLDGNVDHSESGWTVIDHEARSEEAALHAFDQFCRQDWRCTVPGKNVIVSFDALLTEADRGKLLTSHKVQISSRKITEFVYNYALAIAHRPEAFYHVEKLFSRDQRILDMVMEPDPLSYIIVSCHDSISTVPNFAQFQSWINQLKRHAPHMYRYTETLTMYASCLGWSIPARNPPAPLHVAHFLPVFLIANRIDPSTPLDDSLSLHRSIPSSHLLITDAVGHTADANSHCGRAAIAQYILQPRLPATDISYCYG